MEYSNIAKSARGQAGHDLWDELTQSSPSREPREMVDSVVDFIVQGCMSFADLAGYIDLNSIEFYTLSDIGLAHVSESDKAKLGNPTPTEFLRAIVRADLTSYVLEYTLPRQLQQRANGFVYNEKSHSWWDKEFAKAQGIA
ncbi:MAG: hypothetical protein ACXWP0_01180 [Ktedonobacterales bacterium]